MIGWRKLFCRVKRARRKPYNRVGKILNTETMKMQELNNTELLEVNGGSIFGGNDSTSSSDSGLLGNLGIGNLLSYQSASKDGDESSATAFSLGNGITSSLGGLFSNSSQQS